VSAPIIISAEIGGEAFHWLDGLRQRNFPPERNQLPAHLTLFHHLPPSSVEEVARRLKRIVEGPPPIAEARAPMSLGNGVAIRIVSPDLEAVRASLADGLKAC
jgi:hypothetical protein